MSIQQTMSSLNSRIRHWVCTGEHVVLTDYEKPKTSVLSAPSNLTKPSHDDDVSATSTTSSSIPDRLVGTHGDVLVPESADVERVFSEGRQTWTQLVGSAESLPPNLFPPGLGDPCIMLQDMPALPKSIPKAGFLVGQPLWRIQNLEHEDREELKEITQEDDGWDPRYTYGPQKHFCLSFPTPVECRFSLPPCAPGPGRISSRPDGAGFSPAPRGLTILTLCWSYVISVRFLELKGRKAVYSRNLLQPRVVKVFRPEHGQAMLNLGSPASSQLVRWLCAVLAPRPGWHPDRGGFPPWAAFCSGDARFSIFTDKPVSVSPNEAPPSSTQATELLIELCSLYGFSPSKPAGTDAEPLAPATASFLAALALPFYRYVDLKPQFPPVNILRRRRVHRNTMEPLRRYVDDLRYYMTLSMHPRSLGSALWSIFWQPQVECNLVSPWLCSILDTIRPIIDSQNLALLAKVFALRRPRVALWWWGIFLLGDVTVLDWMTRYLETLEERWGFGTMASPDAAVAAWTGSPQSFLDQAVSSRVRRDSADLVPRADLLRLRYNLRLQDTTGHTLSWRPFGCVSKDMVEPELWPGLELGHDREYIHWVWWVEKDNDVSRDVQRGFRMDTARFVANVPDRLEICCVGGQREGLDGDIKLVPSKDSTLRMLSYCMEDVSGDRDMDISIVRGARTHPWLKYWRGLE